MARMGKRLKSAAAEGRTARRATRSRRRWRWRPSWRRRSSTRRSSSPSASASIRARPTRTCAAPWSCRTAPARSVRVAVFAKGEKEREAKEAGADYVGGEDLVKKIQDEGWLEFDNAVATPDMMGLVGRIGKILGPRGLMPNPKLGTVTFDVGKAVSELKAGKVEYRVDKAGIVHVPIGKASFGAREAARRTPRAVLTSIVKAKPASAKGNYILTVAVSSTMGPGHQGQPAGRARAGGVRRMR